MCNIKDGLSDIVERHDILLEIDAEDDMMFGVNPNAFSVEHTVGKDYRNQTAVILEDLFNHNKKVKLLKVSVKTISDDYSEGYPPKLSGAKVLITGKY